MKQPTKSLKFLRHRKFLVVLPVLITPFVALAFWALGGGRNVNTQGAGSRSSTGMNLNLPGANLKDDNKSDKLAAYEKAASDSAKIRDLIRSDPYLKSQFNENDTAEEEKGLVTEKKYADPNEEKVYAKLDKLNKVLNETASGSKIKNGDSYSAAYAQKHPAANADNTVPGDAVKLQELLQKMNEKTSSPAAEDTELRQLNGMLDKIMDIQHPERIKERLQSNTPAAGKQILYSVSSGPLTDNIGLLGAGADSNQPSSSHLFYGLETVNGPVDKQNAIPAVVQENQTLVNGAEIKLRTLADLWVDGHRIPKDHFIYGTVSLNNERLLVAVKSIQDAGSVYPVNGSL